MHNFLVGILLAFAFTPATVQAAGLSAPAGLNAAQVDARIDTAVSSTDTALGADLIAIKVSTGVNAAAAATNATDITARVLKAGDTMTGDLTLQNSDLIVGGTYFFSDGGHQIQDHTGIGGLLLSVGDGNALILQSSASYSSGVSTNAPKITFVTQGNVDTAFQSNSIVGFESSVFDLTGSAPTHNFRFFDLIGDASKFGAWTWSTLNLDPLRINVELMSLKENQGGTADATLLVNGTIVTTSMTVLGDFILSDTLDEALPSLRGNGSVGFNWASVGPGEMYVSIAGLHRATFSTTGLAITGLLDATFVQAVGITSIFDIDALFGNLRVGVDAFVGGAFTSSASVTAADFFGDGAGLTGIPSSATVAGKVEQSLFDTYISDNDVSTNTAQSGIDANTAQLVTVAVDTTTLQSNIDAIPAAHGDGANASSGKICIGIDAAGNCQEGQVDTSGINGSTNPLASDPFFDHVVAQFEHGTGDQFVLVAVDTTSLQVLIDALNGGMAIKVQKSVDEIVSASTVLQDDDDLFITILEAGTTYTTTLSIIYEGSAASSDFDFTFSVPTNSTMTYSCYAGTGNGNTVKNILNYRESGDGAVKSIDMAASTRLSAFCLGQLITGDAGTIQFRWAQGAANGTTTLFADSFLRVVKE